MRLLAVTTARPNPTTPDIPALAEAGVPGCEMSQWYGLLAPADTSAPIIERLNSETGRALKHPELRSRLLPEGAEPAASSPQEFGTFFKAEIAKWTRVVRKAGIRTEQKSYFFSSGGMHEASDRSGVAAGNSRSA